MSDERTYVYLLVSHDSISSLDGFAVGVHRTAEGAKEFGDGISTKFQNEWVEHHDGDYWIKQLDGPSYLAVYKSFLRS